MLSCTVTVLLSGTITAMLSHTVTVMLSNSHAAQHHSISRDSTAASSSSISFSLLCNWVGFSSSCILFLVSLFVMCSCTWVDGHLVVSCMYNSLGSGSLFLSLSISFDCCTSLALPCTCTSTTKPLHHQRTSLVYKCTLCSITFSWYFVFS